MRNLLFLFPNLFAALLLFSSHSFASAYTWRIHIDGGFEAASPSALCTMYAADWAGRLGGRTYNTDIIRQTDTYFKCRIEFTPAPPYGQQYVDMSRIGDSCAAGSTYNQVTGECEKPPEDKCASRAGASSKFNSSGTSGDDKFSFVGDFVIGPNEMCYDGCAVVLTNVNGRLRVDGTYRVWGTKTATGAQCGPGGDNVANGDPDPKPDPVPPVDVDQKPCVYKTNPDGTQSCDSEKVIDKEGHYCGQFQGEEKCVSSPATKNGINISTKVTKTTDPDGKSKIVKTDTTTKTACTPVNKCSSTSTTRTTTTTVGSDGKVISVIGTCNGKDCSVKNEDPDGNGSGNGDCTGTGCGDPFGGSVGSDGFYEPGEDTFESVLTAFQAGVKQIPVVQGAANFLAFSPSGSCPSGSVNVMGMHIQLDQWCGSSIPWPFIAAVVLGIAAILSYRIAFM